MNALEKADLLKERSKQFAIRIVAVVRSLPASREGNVVGNQLLRSGTAGNEAARSGTMLSSHGVEPV